MFTSALISACWQFVVYLIVLYFDQYIAHHRKSGIPVRSDAWNRFNFTSCEYVTSYSSDNVF